MSTHCPTHPTAGLVGVVSANYPPVACSVCGVRYCLDCGSVAPEAWSSGRCHGCYRALSRRIKEERRADERSRWERLTDERDAAVARAEAAEAQTREWRHKYDVLLREHDAATTELAEAVAKVERVRRVRPSHTGCLPWREVRRALDGGAG